jgi:hypothetical protein
MTKHKSLEEVHHDKGFTFKDGTHVKSLRDLVNHLERCSKETFLHHIHDDGSDFYNWIAHVLEDKILSKSIRHVKSKEYLAMVLKEYIRMIEEIPKEGNSAKEDNNTVSSTPVHPDKARIRAVTDVKWGIEEFVLGLLVGFLIALVFLRLF